jgi:hypothetical protein
MRYWRVEAAMIAAAGVKAAMSAGAAEAGAFDVVDEGVDVIVVGLAVERDNLGRGKAGIGY